MSLSVRMQPPRKLDWLVIVGALLLPGGLVVALSWLMVRFRGWAHRPTPVVAEPGAGAGVGSAAGNRSE